MYQLFLGEYENVPAPIGPPHKDAMLLAQWVNQYVVDPSRLYVTSTEDADFVSYKEWLFTEKPYLPIMTVLKSTWAIATYQITNTPLSIIMKTLQPIGYHDGLVVLYCELADLATGIGLLHDQLYDHFNQFYPHKRIIIAYGNS